MTLLQFLHLWCDDQLTVHLLWVSFEVVSVIVFGLKEGFVGLHLCDYGLVPCSFTIKFVDEGLSGRFLGVVVVKDDGSVLGAYIGALAIQGRWVVGGEEDLEEFSEGDHEGIKGYLHDFRVAGGSRAHLLIRGIRHPPARVAGLHFQHAYQVHEYCFGAPEAAAAQCSDFNDS